MVPTTRSRSVKKEENSSKSGMDGSDSIEERKTKLQTRKFFAFSGIKFAMAAGLFAALASILGKLAFDSDRGVAEGSGLNLIHHLLCQIIFRPKGEYVDLCSNAIHADGVLESAKSFSQLISDKNIRIYEISLFVFRIISFGGVFLSNAIMVNLFAKALNSSGSTRATVVNTAANFLFSGLMGWLIFHEMFPLVWWVGAMFIAIGVALVSIGDDQKEEKVHIS